MDNKELVFEKIYEEHKKYLHNLNVKNGKMLICFAGIPGSGKTTIAKVLEERYKGVRINSHKVGQIIRKVKKVEGDRELQNEYQCWILEKKPFENGLIILDSGIERKYEKTFEIAKSKKFKIFIIQLNISKEEAMRRIAEREGVGAENYFTEFDRWEREFENFRAKFKADVVLDVEKDRSFEGVFEVLDRFFSKNRYVIQT